MASETFSEKVIIKSLPKKFLKQSVQEKLQYQLSRMGSLLGIKTVSRRFSAAAAGMEAVLAAAGDEPAASTGPQET